MKLNLPRGERSNFWQWHRQEFMMQGLSQGSQGKFHFPKWHFSFWLLPPTFSFHPPKCLMTFFSRRLKFSENVPLFHFFFHKCVCYFTFSLIIHCINKFIKKNSFFRPSGVGFIPKNSLVYATDFWYMKLSLPGEFSVHEIKPSQRGEKQFFVHET